MVNYIVERFKLAEKHRDNVNKGVKEESLADKNLEEIIASVSFQKDFNKKNCGDAVTDVFIDALTARFQQNPKIFVASKELIDDFKKLAELLATGMPVGHELGIRFHVGKNDNGVYNVIMVPISGLKFDGCDGRPHDSDLEKTLFANSSHLWEGLAFSPVDSPETGEFVSIDTARGMLTKSDQSGIKVVYMTYAKFLEFLPNGNAPYDHMRVKLGRVDSKDGTRKDLLTIAFCFVNTAGNAIRFDGPETGGVIAEVNGGYFDQGDLMPPPPIKDTDINPQP